MASIDQTQNASFDIEWARGDNDPKLFRIKSGGSVVDIICDKSCWTEYQEGANFGVAIRPYPAADLLISKFTKPGGVYR
jgi:hypothetical protein